MQYIVDPNEVLDYLTTCPEGTKLYFGSDSERMRIKDKVTGKSQWYRDITTVVVVHIGGHLGCKIFGEVVRELDFEKNKSKPIMRMMAEVYKCSEMFNRLKEVVDASGFEVEIHLDINPNVLHGSSVAVQQAIGYIQGTCNMTPMLKPESFSASYCADRFKEIQAFKTVAGYHRLSYKRKKRLNEAA